jgi:threonine 3-dehydrogenase
VGAQNVLASDVRVSQDLADAGPFIYCDVTDKDNMARIVLESRITHVVHLATLLSAIGERNPQLALKVNTLGIQNILDVAATSKLSVHLGVALHKLALLPSLGAFPFFSLKVEQSSRAQYAY